MKNTNRHCEARRSCGNLNRLLSIVLVMILLFSGLPMTVFAVDTDDLADTGAQAEIADTGADTIYSVAVTGVIEPVAGAAPTYYASVPSDKGYQVENYTSADYKNGRSLVQLYR